mmetsp:Transcript_7021/g.28736  ORF Transcript_7021/g.28736 Transcript_7021/m.28736 type:complete len:299 (+) Transcript_7021:434-1330(+)
MQEAQLIQDRWQSAHIDLQALGRELDAGVAALADVRHRFVAAVCAERALPSVERVHDRYLPPVISRQLGHTIVPAGADGMEVNALVVKQPTRLDPFERDWRGVEGVHGAIERRQAQRFAQLRLLADAKVKHHALLLAWREGVVAARRASAHSVVIVGPAEVADHVHPIASLAFGFGNALLLALRCKFGQPACGGSAVLMAKRCPCCACAVHPGLRSGRVDAQPCMRLDLRLEQRHAPRELSRVVLLAHVHQRQRGEERRQRQQCEAGGADPHTAPPQPAFSSVRAECASACGMPHGEL